VRCFCPENLKGPFVFSLTAPTADGDTQVYGVVADANWNLAGMKPEFALVLRLSTTAAATSGSIDGEVSYGRSAPGTEFLSIKGVLSGSAAGT